MSPTTTARPVRLAPGAATLLLGERVARFATVGADGAPHLVPVCYAAMVADGAVGALYIALDEKPKRVGPAALKRVRNLAANPAVSLLVDRYDDADWDRLAFLRIDGRGDVLAPGVEEHAGAVAALRAKYPQYRAMALDERPVIRITPGTAHFWEAPPSPLPAAGALWARAPGSPFAMEGEGGLPGPRALPFPELVRGRRSVRRFLPDPVPRPVVEGLIEAAGWAPSPHGRQPWRFAVVTHPALKEALAGAMGVAWVENLRMDGQDEETVAARLAGSHRRIVGAPVLIVPCLYVADLDRYPDPARQAAEETMAVQSLGAAVQNLLLAAYDRGLDAGWMCAPLFCPNVVSDALGLAPGLSPQAIIIVGYAAQDPQRRGRFPVSALIARYD